MYKIEHKDWNEAGSFAAQVNLYGFWDEHCFLTKSGDLGCALKIGGIDYESLDHAGLDYAVKRLEAALRSLDDKCRLYQILFKRNRPAIPHAEYENPLVRAAVEQRSAFLASKSERLYSIEIFWILMVDGSFQKTGLLHALSQLPKHPRASLRELRALFSGNKERSLLYEQVERDRMRLQQKVNSLSGQLNDLMTVGLPGAEETFRILRRLVNLRPSKIDDAPLCNARHLDWQVCDSELEAHRGYLRLDDDYVRVLTLKELPSETRPLLLQGLLDVPANFHVVTEWHPVTNEKARKEIASRRRHHHNSKTSFVSNLQDRDNKGNQDNLVDDSKAAAVAELGNALTAMGMEGKNFGELTLSVVIYDEDHVKVEHTIAEFQKLFTQHDGLLYQERYNLLNAFFATIPGNRQFNLRKQWALNSNYADLSFLFTVDTGSAWNPHLEREYLAVLESTHGTPYYLNLHSGDVAHTLMLGATGSGKSFCASMLLQSAQKYEPLTFVFDLGGSYETLTRAFGGSYLNVGLKNPGFSINPLSLEATHENLNFLFLFLRVLIEGGGRYELTTADEKALFAGLERIYKLPREIRTLTNFASILGPLGERLHRWTQAGQFGYLFDNVDDTLTFARFQTFNFDGWSDYPDILEPLLFYVLQRASSKIEISENVGTFKPFLIDEAWIFLKNKIIRDWITRAEKTWRKKNAAMILATQSVVELAASDMLHIINESCPTKIFLANPNIDRKLYAEIFQLNDTQLELLESLVPKRELLVIQPRGTKKLVLEVDALSYWMATNNARDNIRKQDYFNRFGPEQGLLRLAEDYPNPLNR
ncbi:VirB4 family type IV secretion system protein [Silvibacterium acidisoli]|uniref:VirB4 family type IV secretion system protein n=1 Tax=Acidobacteriaceae bacterium ZG23-2 TaxID=2883246 RepID=UPI00406C9FAC